MTEGTIATSECPFECLVNGVCGTEEECASESGNPAVLISVSVISGLIFIAAMIGIYCCFCRGPQRPSGSGWVPITDEEDDAFKNPTHVAVKMPGGGYYMKLIEPED